MTTSTSNVSARTTTYESWFAGTIDRLDRLLDRAAAPMPPSGSLETLGSLQLEWATVTREIQSMTPSREMHAQHEWLLASARLADVAVTRRMEAARLVTEASAGERGATMLLNRARAELARATLQSGAHAR